MVENSMSDWKTMVDNSTSGVLGAIDQYELVRELGGGGFGTVYLAHDTVAGIDVAVKGLPPLVRHNKEELENIRRNFALVSRLHHPNIAAALTLHPVAKAVYNDRSDAEKLRVFNGDTLVVMQYAPGVTLSQWRKQFPENKVPIDQALEIVRQVASALDYAHREKILHRDIKPANVMIETAADGKVTARVLDFGLAAEIRSSMGRVSREVTDTSGTRPYMAPEQWLGKEQGRATDQYALAVMFHELVTGNVPFASVFETGDPIVMMNVVGREAPEVPSSLPKNVRISLAKALAKTQTERFDSCVEFVDALSGKVKVSRGSAKRRMGMFFALAAGLLGVGVVGAWYWKCEQEKARILAEERRVAEAKKAEEEAKRKAEELKIQQELYEMKGRAENVRTKSLNEEWGKWKHFDVHVRNLEAAYLAGVTAFENKAYDIARREFSMVREEWMWLSSNKAARVDALIMKQGAIASLKSATAAGAATVEMARLLSASNGFEAANAFFDKGDFVSAKADFVSAKKHFDEIEKKAAAESAKRNDIARRLLPFTKKMTPKEVWAECLKLKLEPESQQERVDVNETIELTKKFGVFSHWPISFEDVRKSDWSDPYVLYVLGKRSEQRNAEWMPNPALSLAFYERSLEMGCTNAASEVSRLKEHLFTKPFFDVIETGDIDLVKALISKENPCLAMTNRYGRTIMSYAAQHGDSAILEYLESIGHSYKVEDANGETPIFAACANTNGLKAISCIKWLVDKGVDVNARNYKAKEFDNPYPVLGVCSFQAFNYLLDQGVKIDVKGRSGDTLLHSVASRSDDFALVSKVVSMYDDMNVVNEKGETPLHSAIGGNSQCVDSTIRLLVDKGADVNRRVGAGYMKGYQAIHLAAYSTPALGKEQQKRRAVYELIRAGADINSYTSIDAGLFEGVTPLMLASKEGNLPVVEELLYRDADVMLQSRKYNKGYLALHMIEGGGADDCKILDLLLYKGCSVDAKVGNNEYDESNTLLHLLCRNNNVSNNRRRFIRHILAKGASRNLKTSAGTYKAYTPLGLACNERNYVAIKVLVEAGCNVSCGADDDDAFPMHIIAQKDPVDNGSAVSEIIRFLLANGADINAKYTGKLSYAHGRTPLHFAMDYPSKTPVGLLVKNGADIEALDSDGETPLWIACADRRGISDVQVSKIKELLELGANPSVRNKKGRSLVSEIKDVKVRNLVRDYLLKKTKTTGEEDLRHGLRKAIELSGGVMMDMIYCAPGSFTMGSLSTEQGRFDDEILHNVKLTKGFWLGETEVTQGQWKSVMGETVLDLAKKGLEDDTVYNIGGKKQTLRQYWDMARDDDPALKCGDLDDDIPVYNVSWHDAKMFCRRLTRMHQAKGLLPEGWEYRLPTEAEWEYACRADTTTSLPNGREINIVGANNAPALDAIAWYGGNSSVDFSGRGVDTSGWHEKQYPGGHAFARKVRGKMPNEWGFYDMIGNVYEWCEDWYGSYPTSFVVDPTGSASGDFRVLRGGSWDGFARYCRSALRVRDNPGLRSSSLGFRLACSALP